MKIKKRDGRIVLFDQNKIIDAVLAAFKEVDGELTDYAYAKAGNIADYIQEIAQEKERKYFENSLENTEQYLDIESIQNLVENGLMSTKRKDVARAYITYRNARTAERNRNSAFMQTIAEKLTASNVQNQNANVDEHSFGGRMGEANEALTKQYALDYCISKKARDNHINNRIYIHDLSHYAVGDHNCLSVPFDKLLAKGFNTRQSDVRPANSINTAFQLVAVLFQLQSLQQFGGVSATHLDWTMVPYVRKSFFKHFKIGCKYFYEDEPEIKPFDDITKIPIDCEDYKYYAKAYKYATEVTNQELKQAVEAMYHNLNTLQSRSGNQLPFTSINYGTCTLLEGRMVTKAILEGSLEGTGALHKTPIFPCGIFQYMKGVNDKPGTPNYDLYRLALKSTSRRLYPNYANVDWSGNAGYDRNDPCTYFSTMGCRTANGWDINGMGQTKDGRGNICPVTIILPTIAMEAKEKIEVLAKLSNSSIEEYDLLDQFIYDLDKAIEDAKDMLIERFNWICSQSPESAKFMYENGTMEGYIPEEGIRSALKHGTLAVG